ncbi:hypothetical protein GW17_00041083 [Ensete ventricosum]|nr:hypothetical protein GW17_00041083 [Ensete ventricosum]
MQNLRAAATHKKFSSKSIGIKANAHGRSCARQRLSNPVTKRRSWKLDPLPPSILSAWVVHGRSEEEMVYHETKRKEITVAIYPDHTFDQVLSAGYRVFVNGDRGIPAKIAIA